MGNFYSDNDDLRFHFERGVDWKRLYELTEHGGRAPDALASPDEAADAYREVMEALGALAADELAPHALELDRQGLHLDRGEVQMPERMRAFLDQVRDLGMFGVAVPRELGGLNCPILLQLASMEVLSRADVSVGTHIAFHGAIAVALLKYSMDEGSLTVDRASARITSCRFAEEIGEIIGGGAWGSMDITEPHAGSDMASLKTRADQGPDGSWRLNGQKIFITAGHGKYHVVIARTEPDSGSTAGLAGLSLFLVPAYEDTPSGRRRFATIERIEEKMGHHASATCVINFDDTPAKLIGKRGDGFPYMLALMNGARIAVAFEALGLAEAAYRQARDYAALRTSMGKPIERHEMIADYLDEMRTDIQGIRALTVAAAVAEETAMRLSATLRYYVEPGSFEAKRLERELRKERALARRLTPLVKYAATEKALEIAGRSVQIHGGAGYIREVGAEKLVRDAYALVIYEGTSQIQALMAMKDVFSGILKNPQQFIKRSTQARWRSLSARDPLERRVAKVTSLALSAQQHLLSRTAADKVRGVGLTQLHQIFTRDWDPKRDFSYAMLHAERLTKLLADAAICETLFAEQQRFPERRELLLRYLERAEPRCRYLLDEISSTGERLLAELSRNEAATRAGKTA
jgi:3-(methylthio)propanoyl-CoA dehydrogenase